MLVLLPLVSFGLLVAIFRREHDWRRQTLLASIPWALFVVLTTECLSVFHLLTRAWVALAWSLFLLAAVGWLMRSRNHPEIEEDRRAIDVTPDEALTRVDRVLMYCVGLIAIFVGLSAVFSAPNTWDAMEYHMPRVVEWIANRGVQLYPTIDHQQLSMPPMAEYIILHLNHLYGGDRLANLVQWFAFVGSILGITLIVEELGGNRRVQIFSAVLAATLPTAILGSSGAKNDQVLAYWVTVSVYFLMRWRVRRGWLETFALGTALSLAVFSKGTAYTFLPLLAVACMLTWDKAALRKFFVRLPVFAALLLVVSVPLWVRCYQFSGSIFGPPYFPGAGSEEIRMMRTARITPPLVVANAIRNVGLDVGSPSEGVNEHMTRALSGMIRMIGEDPNDHRQIVVGQTGRFYPFRITTFSLLESESSNPIQTLLFFAAGVLYLANFRKMKRSTGWLGVGIVGAFMMYAAVVRWSPWNARYQVSLFVLAAGFIALVLSRVLPRTVILGISFFLLVCAIPYALRNETRPLLTKSAGNSVLVMPRDETYFLDHHQSDGPSFIAAANAVSGEACQAVGLDANRLHFDYPMLALLNKDGKPRRLSYVSVDNGTKRYASTTAPPPCVVVCLGCARSEEKWNQYHDSEPNPSVFGDIVVFRYPGGFVERTAAASEAGLPAK